MTQICRQKDAGSSPRVRGTLQRKRLDPQRRRFIPAGAGNTPPVVAPWSARAVHPRACGEYSTDVKSGSSMIDSSPRVRGTHPAEPRPPGQVRFIPARAGNTMQSSACAGCSAVHPRACGEHADVGFRLAHALGSSPRVRGTHSWRLATCRGDSGSSPRVRGTRLSLDHRSGEFRFIPARAGNTQIAPAEQERPTVHPRVCGEHKAHRIVIGRQFIPARAGNMRRSPCQAGPAAVHPRACGEHHNRLLHLRSGCGSSPRVRGTRRRGSGPHP